MKQDVIEKLGRGGDVEQAVAFSAASGIDLVEALGEGLVAVLIIELRFVIGDAFDEFPPDFLVVAGAGDLLVQLFQAAAEFFVGLVAACEADDVHAGRQLAVDGEIVERGDELAVGEVTGGAENDHRAWLRAVAGN